MAALHLATNQRRHVSVRVARHDWKQQKYTHGEQRDMHGFFPNLLWTNALLLLILFIVVALYAIVWKRNRRCE